MDWQAAFKNLQQKIIGIGITAFNRVGPAYFLPDYQMICYKNSLDVDQIRKKCQVKTIKADFQSDLKKLNSLAILKHPGVQEYLKKIDKVGLFLYKSTKKIEKVADQHGWQILTNRSETRDPYENKKVFREVLEKVGAELIPAKTIKLSDFNEKVFEECQKEFGSNLVFQLPEVTKGGGRGNTFISQKSDLVKFRQKVAKLGETFNLEHLIIAKFIESISPSITGCVTRHGVLTGVVQTQVMDIPEVINLKKGAGLFCGHDWSFCHYSSKIQQQADKIAKSFGSYLAKHGYKGIFGLDLLLEKGTDKIYACECNPRYTGAFPVYSMIQWQQNEPAFDVFQLLEHLNLDYQLDFKAIDAQYKQKKQGAHLIIYNQTEDYLKVGKDIQAGVWRLGKAGLEFLRQGFALEDIQEKSEFMITDGAPHQGDIIRPGLRILKILFKESILAPGGKGINQAIKKIVREVYQQLQLKQTLP